MVLYWAHSRLETTKGLRKHRLRHLKLGLFQDHRTFRLYREGNTLQRTILNYCMHRGGTTRVLDPGWPLITLAFHAH
jgi:hypothetical protein